MNDANAAQPIPIGLLVGSWLPGSETFIYDQLLRAKRTRGFVCARRRLPDAARTFPYDHLCTLGPAAELLFKLTRQAPAFVRYCRSRQVRLIHAHFGVNGAHALDLVDSLDVPLVVTFHGHDVAGLETRNRFRSRYFQYQWSKKRLWQRSSLLLCSSSDLAERLVSVHGAPADKVRVHRLGVDVERLRPVKRDDGGQTVLSVGRLVEKKGLVHGLRAFARVLADRPQARYRIIGAGPLRSELEREARDLGIGGVVQFLGALDHEQVCAEMERADILLCPSVTAADGDLESGVLVLKEAAATGLPTVASTHGGIPEIVENGRTGYLVAERDVQGLAERLARLLQDSALREQLGGAAAQKMRDEYDTRTQNARLEELLLACL